MNRALVYLCALTIAELANGQRRQQRLVLWQNAQDAVNAGRADIVYVLTDDATNSYVEKIACSP